MTEEGMKIAIYASAHGYGHTSRCYEVARAIVQQYPQAQVHFMSFVPEKVIASELHPGIAYRRIKLDVGMRQVDSLQIDIPGTLTELDQLARDSENLIEEEASFLQSRGITRVLCDLPPMAFEAAFRAGIPAFGMANFSWDWIYEAYVKKHPGFKAHVEWIRRAYRTAIALFRLPMYGAMKGFRNIIDVPLVARRSSLGKEEARRRLGMKPDQSVVLFSFGGYGHKLKLDNSDPQEFILLSTEPSPDPGGRFLHLTDQRRAQVGLRYPDLVAAADTVVSKPGYGIVSECIANRTPLLYTPRGPFREYPVLLRGLKRYLPSACINESDLISGNWRRVFEKIRHKPFPEAPDCSGAEAVAEKLFTYES